MSVGTAVMDRLAADLDELAEVDPGVFADGEALVDLTRQLERLVAVTTRTTAAFDARWAWKPDGARSAAVGWPPGTASPATKPVSGDGLRGRVGSVRDPGG